MNKRSQPAVTRVHRDNHYLPLRRGMASPAQVAAVEQALGVLLQHLSHSIASDEMLRAGLTVRLMIDLGRSAQQLHELDLVELSAAAAAAPTKWGFVSWDCTGRTKYGWWLPAGVHVDADSPEGAEQVRGVIWLPVLERTVPWLILAGWVRGERPALCLAVTPQDVERNIAAFHSWTKATLGPLARALPRADRLCRILVEQLARQPAGDRPLAMQLSGQDMKHSVARGYYTSLNCKKAAEYYAKGVQSPVADLSLITLAGGAPEIAVPAFAATAMTRKEPKGSTDLMVSALELLGNKPDQRQRNSDLVEAHNNMVVRLWIVLALSMAIRSVNLWVPGLRRIEPRTGALIVLDKDREVDDPPGTPKSATLGSSLGRARLVFLHPLAREMLEFYLEHLRKLVDRSGIDEKSREMIRQHIEGLAADGLLPFLILKNRPKGVVARPAKPSWFSAVQRGLTDVKGNFARHALRSGLLGQIPQSAIDAFLGHFDRGTEPWTNGSALDPSAYRALLHLIFEAHFAHAAKFDESPRKPKLQRGYD